MQLTLTNICLTYDHQHRVLDHLNETFPAGQLIALLGPSGSGKTTLLNLLAGLLTPTKGQVTFDGVDVTHLDARQRNVGMVFQDFALYPHLTVLDNIAFPLKMAHVKKRVRRQRARELAHLVHLDDQLTRLPRELSGGQQQRVAIARALIKQPALLLLDEPLSNLDATLRVELRDEIARIQRQTGVTTIFVTHDPTDALTIADTIIILADGQIQQVAQGTELYQQPRNVTVAKFIGLPQINLLPFDQFAAQLTATLPPDVRQRAVTVGLRSEALQLPAPAAALATISATVTSQVQLGRDWQTRLTWQATPLISTAITTSVATGQTVMLGVAPAGCLLFDATGSLIWTGGAS